MKSKYNYIIYMNNTDKKYDQSDIPQNDSSFFNLVTSIVILLISLLIFGLIIKLSWNYCIPSLFNLREINIQQSIALLILIRILMSPMGNNIYLLLKSS